MIDQNDKGISYTAGFFILIAFCLAGILFYQIVAEPVWENMTGLPFKKLNEGMTDPANSATMKVLQAMNAVLGFLLPAMVVATFMNGKPMKLLGYSGSITFRQVSVVMGIMVAAIFVSLSLTWFNDKIPIPDNWRIQFDKAEQEYNQRVVAILQLNSTGDFILSLVIMAFLPALCEETLFRGGLQNFLTKGTRIPWLSILIVSIIFSLAHWSYYGFLSRIFLGVILGLIFHYTGRLWLCILAHFLNNALAVTIIYVSKLQGKPMQKAVEENASTYWFIILLPLVIGLLVLLRKTSKRDSVPSPTFLEKNQNTLST